MNTIKSLILGSAAGLLAMSGAQAADLPVKAKAVEYVRICSLYGAGFFYIPGTDTCIKLGGYLRVDTTFNGNGTQDAPAWTGDPGQVNRYRDYFTTRSRLAFTVDTRTATEYGVVRTFGQADFQFDTLGSATFNPNSLATNLGNNGNLLNSAGGGYTAVELVFLQFAGFTFGKSASAYATPWHGYPGNNSSSLIGGHDTVTGVNNIQYTAQFGNGVSGTIGLDDPTVFNRTAVFDLSTGLNATGTTGNAYDGVHAPDIVGNIRIDQAWGLFQISAAAHEVGASYNILTAATAAPTNLSEISGHPDTKWGGSVMAALNIKNIPTGAGDDLKIDATYAKGDTKNVISTSGASPSFAMFSGSGRAFQSVGFGATTDAIYQPTAFGGTGDLKLTEAYGFRGAFNHNWDPFWSSSLFGSGSWVHYSGSSADLSTAKGQFCAQYVASNKLTAATTSADFSCNPDYAVFQVGAITRWTPVKNLTFSGEVMYTRLDQKFTGAAVLTPSAPKPTALYEFKNQDTVSFNVRAQRNF
ncbi:Porin subfamily protein [Bradyrhizobium lablabi]|uniref:Porin n=1 Tax=Bradyrhizobium lablabi TaxID=722472 RepID=A0A1M7D9W1_9BRAD|nr:porin [Bradyrhizobium lablabi]SHL75979.1 Porin subfamily protein [Bradyrhizobium lablabi]